MATIVFPAVDFATISSYNTPDDVWITTVESHNTLAGSQISTLAGHRSSFIARPVEN